MRRSLCAGGGDGYGGGALKSTLKRRGYTVTMPSPRLLRFAPVAALALLGLSVWRLLLAASQRTDVGAAQRQHSGLLVLQGACALFAAGAVLGVRDAIRCEERGMTKVYCGILVVALAGFLLIFAKRGLLDFGTYEN